LIFLKLKKLEPKPWLADAKYFKNAKARKIQKNSLD
jgi:hypothetical protein